MQIQNNYLTRLQLQFTPGLRAQGAAALTRGGLRSSLLQQRCSCGANLLPGGQSSTGKRRAWREMFTERLDLWLY